MKPYLKGEALCSANDVDSQYDHHESSKELRFKKDLIKYSSLRHLPFFTLLIYTAFLGAVVNAEYSKLGSTSLLMSNSSGIKLQLEILHSQDCWVMWLLIFNQVLIFFITLSLMQTLKSKLKSETSNGFLVQDSNIHLKILGISNLVCTFSLICIALNIFERDNGLYNQYTKYPKIEYLFAELYYAGSLVFTISYCYSFTSNYFKQLNSKLMFECLLVLLIILVTAKVLIYLSAYSINLSAFIHADRIGPINTITLLLYLALIQIAIFSTRSYFTELVNSLKEEIGENYEVLFNKDHIERNVY